MSRCNEIVHTIEATGLDVCIAGDRCAMHVHSRQGTTVVLLTLQDFLAGARQSTDANGHRIPSLGQSLRVEEQLHADATSIAPHPSKRRGQRRMPPEQLALYQAAQRDYISGNAKSMREAAEKNGIAKPNAFKVWLSSQIQERRSREGRAPLTKPNGRLL